MKEFDTWNNLKKKIELRENPPFANKRDIWWCSIGLNIGSEQDGKNELFERPVLVIKVYSKTMLRVIPLTSKSKMSPYHVPISYSGRIGTAVVSQAKTISTKRLSRKLSRLDPVQFKKVLQAVRESL